MLAKGSDWSSLVRTTSHGCGPMRGGMMGIVMFKIRMRGRCFSSKSTALILAFLGELDGGVISSLKNLPNSAELICDRLDAELGEFFLHRGHLQRLFGHVVQLFHDRRRRLCRRR